jgi:hypothetical protein
MPDTRDSERLDWFARNADNMLVRRWADGTFAFYARASREVVFPAPGMEPWTDLRSAIDAAMDAAPALVSTTEGGGQ